MPTVYVIQICCYALKGELSHMVVFMSYLFGLFIFFADTVMIYYIVYMVTLQNLLSLVAEY